MRKFYGSLTYTILIVFLYSCDDACERSFTIFSGYPDTITVRYSTKNIKDSIITIPSKISRLQGSYPNFGVGGERGALLSREFIDKLEITYQGQTIYKANNFHSENWDYYKWSALPFNGSCAVYYKFYCGFSKIVYSFQVQYWGASPPVKLTYLSPNASNTVSIILGLSSSTSDATIFTITRDIKPSIPQTSKGSSGVGIDISSYVANKVEVADSAGNNARSLATTDWQYEGIKNSRDSTLFVSYVLPLYLIWK